MININDILALKMLKQPKVVEKMYNEHKEELFSNQKDTSNE
jgi:hypothetical protein